MPTRMTVMEKIGNTNVKSKDHCHALLLECKMTQLSGTSVWEFLLNVHLNVRCSQWSWGWNWVEKRSGCCLQLRMLYLGFWFKPITISQTYRIELLWVTSICWILIKLNCEKANKPFINRVLYTNHFYTYSPIICIGSSQQPNDCFTNTETRRSKCQGDSRDHTTKLWLEDGRMAGAGAPHLESLTNCLGFHAVSPLLSGVTSLPKGTTNVILCSFYSLTSSNQKFKSAVDTKAWVFLASLFSCKLRGAGGTLQGFHSRQAVRSAWHTAASATIAECAREKDRLGKGWLKPWSVTEWCQPRPSSYC